MVNGFPIQNILEDPSLDFRNTPSTAGNSVTSSERPSPEPILKKEASPAGLGGGENSGNALEASNALNKKGFGASQPYSRGKFQETL